jgi:hypothetical protein
LSASRASDAPRAVGSPPGCAPTSSLLNAARERAIGKKNQIREK